jgi:hypothetical protein
MTMCCLDEQHWGQPLLYHESTLFQLLQMGTVDSPLLDRPWNASTRVMRYASSVGDHLWELLLEEWARVSVWATPSWLELPDTSDSSSPYGSCHNFVDALYENMCINSWAFVVTLGSTNAPGLLFCRAQVPPGLLWISTGGGNQPIWGWLILPGTLWIDGDCQGHSAPCHDYDCFTLFLNTSSPFLWTLSLYFFLFTYFSDHSFQIPQTQSHA